MQGVATEQSFGDFVLSTCNPSHVKSARMGMTDWVQTGPVTYVSPSTGYQHDCQPHTCKAWVLRFVDGVKICAISGKMHLNPPSQQSSMMEEENVPSPTSRKRVSHGEDMLKRHQDKPIPGSTAYLTAKFNLDGEDMDMEGCSGVVTGDTPPLFVGRKAQLY